MYVFLRFFELLHTFSPTVASATPDLRLPSQLTLIQNLYCLVTDTVDFEPGPVPLIRPASTILSLAVAHSIALR